jgi:3',5'-cyclic AMP phosphodiesterase CpdA
VWWIGRVGQVISNGRPSGGLFGISDVHVGNPENREVVESLRAESDNDWLIVAGDVAEQTSEIKWVLQVLRDQFHTVIWVPGNHELWTLSQDPITLRGQARYQHLVDLCRELGVITPEDPYPIWQGPGGPARIAPLFLLYDYTFRVEGTHTKQQSLAYAHQTGVVCTDEVLLHADPYPSREAWCQARVAETERRLVACDPGVPLVLVNHWPLIREPTRRLRYPEFAQWCGTQLTADWHRRFNVAAVVYGHLHIRRSTVHDGVRFEEVSLGYPREWTPRGLPCPVLRPILPAPEAS